MESFIKKVDECTNNPKKFSTKIIGEHIPCGYSMSTIWAFNNIENKHTLYRREDCMKKFCESLREPVKTLIDFEKKKLLSLTKEERKLHQDARSSYIYGKRFPKKVC